MSTDRNSTGADASSSAPVGAVNPTEVIAEALAEHWLDRDGECMSQDHEGARTFFDTTAEHAAHQASVIAALPNIAIVELPSDPGDSDYLRWSHWNEETEEAFHEALLGELRRIHAVSVAAARTAGGES